MFELYMVVNVIKMSIMHNIPPRCECEPVRTSEQSVLVNDEK